MKVASAVVRLPGLQGRRMRAFVASALWAAFIAMLPLLPSAHEGSSWLLDNLDNAGNWRLSSSDDIRAALHADQGALCLDFDFKGVSGFVSLRRELRLSFHGHYALSLLVRGDSAANTLQVKLIDAGGDNVWWINRPDFVFRDQWQVVRAEARQIEFAWGPTQDRTLHETAAVEITLTAGKGGRGRIWFDELRFEQLPPPLLSWPAVIAQASSALPDAPAAKALDGATVTSWRSDPAQGPRQILDIDFGAPRPFGGIVLYWLPDRWAARYRYNFQTTAWTIASCAA
jgi:hypothetical protein